MRDITYRDSIILYFGVPIAMGFLLGWYNVYADPSGSKLVSIFGWILHFEAYWVIAFALIKILDKCVGPLNFPKLLQYIFITLITSFCLRTLNWLIYALLIGATEKARVMPINTDEDIKFFEFSFSFISKMILDYFPHSFLWLCTCILIVKFGNELIFRMNGAQLSLNALKLEKEKKDDNVHDKNEQIHFINQIKPELGTMILLLKAEGHYIRTITDQGEDLIYYRFGDAIDQLSSKGMRVHRSYWVSYILLNEENTKIENDEIILMNYDNIPIGYSFKRQVLEHRKT